MDTEHIVTTIAAVGGLLGGAGGIAALLRARSQNKVDERTQLSTEQQAFRRDMASELATLRAVVSSLSTDKDKLEQLLAEQGRQLERLKTLDEIKTGQIKELEAKNSALEKKVTEQQQQIVHLREQKDSVERQLLQVTAAREFLERENTQLRRENELLRAGAAHPSGTET